MSQKQNKEASPRLTVAQNKKTSLLRNFMDKFLIWNIRGMANVPSLRRLNKLVRINNCVFFTILEPKVRKDDISCYQRKLRCTGSVANNQNTIWVFWKNLNCQVIEVEEQQITVSVPLLDGSNGIITSIFASCDGRKRRDL